MSSLAENCILRRARKTWRCAGDGAATPEHAEHCDGVIAAGEQYVEYVGEAHAYQSGSRHSIGCAVEFLGWPRDWDA